VAHPCIFWFRMRRRDQGIVSNRRVARGLVVARCVLLVLILEGAAPFGFKGAGFVSSSKSLLRRSFLPLSPSEFCSPLPRVGNRDSRNVSYFFWQADGDGKKNPQQLAVGAFHVFLFVSSTCIYKTYPLGNRGTDGTFSVRVAVPEKSAA